MSWHLQLNATQVHHRYVKCFWYLSRRLQKSHVSIISYKLHLLLSLLCLVYSSVLILISVAWEFSSRSVLPSSFLVSSFMCLCSLVSLSMPALFCVSSTFLLPCSYFLFYFVRLFSLVFCIQFHFPLLVFINHRELFSHLSPILSLSCVCIYCLSLPLFSVVFSLLEVSPSSMLSCQLQYSRCLTLYFRWRGSLINLPLSWVLSQQSYLWYGILWIFIHGSSRSSVLNIFYLIHPPTYWCTFSNHLSHASLTRLPELSHQKTQFLVFFLFYLESCCLQLSLPSSG